MCGSIFITARITWLLGENLYPGIIENNIFATLFQIAILIVVIDGCIEKSVHWKRNLSLYLFWQCAIFIINTAIVRGIINTGIFGASVLLRAEEKSNLVSAVLYHQYHAG